MCYILSYSAKIVTFSNTYNQDVTVQFITPV